VWEVDVPTTQAEKRSMLHEAGVSTRHVTFVPVDFETQDAMDELIRAGMDPAAKTLIIWEGVTYYLSEPAVRSTLCSIANRMQQARVAFDVFYKWFAHSAGLGFVMRRGFGEPIRCGVPTGDEGRLAREAGLQVLSITSAEELSMKFCPRRADGSLSCSCFGAVAFVLASTPNAAPQSF
jgi:methyltransferase (TIGR00027 family)